MTARVVELSFDSSKGISRGLWGVQVKERDSIIMDALKTCFSLESFDEELARNMFEQEVKIAKSFQKENPSG